MKREGLRRLIARFRPKGADPALPLITIDDQGLIKIWAGPLEKNAEKNGVPLSPVRRYIDGVKLALNPGAGKKQLASDIERVSEKGLSQAVDRLFEELRPWMSEKQG